MEFEKVMFDLGYSQSSKGLPLVFIQNENITRLQTESRLESLEMTKPVKKILETMLKDLNLEATDRNMVDLLTTNFECLTTINNGNEDLNKVELVLKEAYNTRELNTKDSKYLELLNKISVQTIYGTLNEDKLRKYYYKFKQEELNNRTLNALAKNLEGLFKDYSVEIEEQEDELRLCKVDLHSGKITNMQKARQYLNVVTIYQVVGYMIGLEDLIKTGLYEVEYQRADYKTRKQFISRDPKVVSDIYNGQLDIINSICNKQTNMEEVLEGISIPETAVTGFYKVPDLGRNVPDLVTRGISDILRKITVTNILNIRKVEDEEYISTVSDLSLMIEHDLDNTVHLFETNVNSATPEKLIEIKEVFDKTPGLLHIKSDSGITSFDLIDSCHMTVTSYSTTGQRTILRMMLENPELFTLPSKTTELKVIPAEEVKYTGNLNDMFNF